MGLRRVPRACSQSLAAPWATIGRRSAATVNDAAYPGLARKASPPWATFGRRYAATRKENDGANPGLARKASPPWAIFLRRFAATNLLSCPGRVWAEADRKSRASGCRRRGVAGRALPRGSAANPSPARQIDGHLPALRRAVVINPRLPTQRSGVGVRHRNSPGWDTLVPNAEHQS